MSVMVTLEIPVVKEKIEGFLNVLREALRYQFTALTSCFSLILFLLQYEIVDFFSEFLGIVFCIYYC